MYISKAVHQFMNPCISDDTEQRPVQCLQVVHNDRLQLCAFLQKLAKLDQIRRLKHFNWMHHAVAVKLLDQACH